MGDLNQGVSENPCIHWSSLTLRVRIRALNGFATADYPIRFDP